MKDVHLWFAADLARSRQIVRAHARVRLACAYGGVATNNQHGGVDSLLYAL